VIDKPAASGTGGTVALVELVALAILLQATVILWKV
jgi:hypothetical protein